MKPIYALAAVAILWAPPFAPAAVPASPAACTRTTSASELEGGTDCIRHYAVKGEPKPALRETLAEVNAELIFGPVLTGAGGKRQIFSVRAPWTLADRQLEKILKRSTGKLEALACTVFEGGVIEGQLPSLGPGFSERDHVIGMTGSLRWWVFEDGRNRFFHEPGKIDAEELTDRFHKLYKPFGGARIGTLAGESLRWTLEPAPEERAWSKLEKKLSKLPGVESAALDGALLHLEVKYEDLEVWAATESSSEAETPPEPAFGTAAVRALLAEQKIAVSPAAPSEEE